MTKRADEIASSATAAARVSSCEGRKGHRGVYKGANKMGIGDLGLEALFCQEWWIESKKRAARE